MNMPAVELYLTNRIDIRKEPLEISVCVQHNNGGLKGNIWWESDLPHLFPVGEVNGSHGVYRPGGSALNSGQTGSYRAAFYIAKKYNYNPPPLADFLSFTEKQIENKLALAVKWLAARDEKLTNSILLKEIRQRMSETAGIIREYHRVSREAKKASELTEKIDELLSAKDVAGLAEAFRIREHCLTHYVYLEAIRFYLESGGRSRGSYIVLSPDGIRPHEKLDDRWRFSLCRYDMPVENDIIEARLNSGKVIIKQTPVRPIPDQELWFEKVWKKNLEDKITEC